MHANSMHLALRAVALMPLLAMATSLQAQSARLAATETGDLIPHRVVAAAGVSENATTERTPIDYYQPIPADTALDDAPRPHLAESREYWQQVDATTLADGYALALTAPGAVVLLSPGVDADALHRGQIAIETGGRAQSLDVVSDTLVDSSHLQAAGMDVRAGSIGFRLQPGVEADARLRVTGARGTYLLHVLEPRSRHVASTQARADTIHAGSTIAFDVALHGGGAIDAATGVLVSPDGQTFDISYRSEGATWRGQVTVPRGVATPPGLWDVRTSIAARAGEAAFQRDVRTAIAVVAPTARIAAVGSAPTLGRAGAARALPFQVEVATAGRYELRGVVYGHDSRGESVPLGVVFSARWLEPGMRTLPLSLPADLATANGPLQIRDLRLTDQSRVALLERRAAGVQID